MTKSYTEEDLQDALDAVANGLSVRKASQEWGIPRTSIQNRLTGRQPRNKAFSSFQRLSPTQEALLTSWILTQGALGLPPTHAQVRVFAERILRAQGDTQPLGKRWMSAFLDRNPSIKTMRSNSMDSKRMNGATTEVIQSWFTRLQVPEIKKVRPENRHNMDEAGLLEGLGGNGLVLGSAEHRSIRKKQPGSLVWTSFIECVSATGTALPPLVIFKGKSVQQQWFPTDSKDSGVFKDWQFTATPNGWTTNETAVEWLQKVFIPYTATDQPRLLILDRHGSHTTTEFMHLCFQNHIYLLFLPPHTSHVLQPLDLSVFSPLKSAYRKQIDLLVQATDSTVVGKKNFICCYQKARTIGLTSKNITSGWKASGLWPVSMAKPLISNLLLKDIDLQPGQTFRDLIHTPIASMTPAQPISRPETSSQPPSTIVWTPRKAKDLRDQIYQSNQVNQHTSIQRLLFQKVTKAFDENTYQLATATSRIQALESQIKALRPQKRKRVETSPNSKFVNIEAIQRAQNREPEVAISSDEISGIENTSSTGSCIVVDLNDEEIED